MEYKLYVYCRRNGVSHDCGLHASQEFSDDEAAVRELKERAENDLGPLFDEVSCTVKEGGRVVEKFTI